MGRTPNFLFLIIFFPNTLKANWFRGMSALIYYIIIIAVSPVLANVPPRMDLIEGKELQIDCIVLLGNPRPKTNWLKVGKGILKKIKNILKPK
jgi:hypothetical protein